MEHEIVESGRGQEYEWSSDRILVKTVSSVTKGRVTVVEDTLKPGFHLPRHYHKEMAEIFYVLDGEVAFRFDDRTVLATAGTTINIPAQVRHDVSCENGARLLTIFSPGGFEGYLAEMASLQPDQFADPELMKSLAERYDIWTDPSV